MLKEKFSNWWKYKIWFPIRHCAITFLSDIPKQFLTAKQYKHSFFIDDIAYQVVYVDIRGRTWSKSWGIKKPEIPTYTIKNGKRTWIDKLGGMSWIKQDEFFVCKYRVG